MSESATAKSEPRPAGRREFYEAALPTTGCVFGSLAAEIHTDANPNLRTTEPGLLDFFDHVGNGLEGGGIGALAFVTMHYALSVYEVRKNRDISPVKRIVVTVLSALAIGAGANAAVETQWGYEHIGRYPIPEQTPDIYDGVYGTGATIAVAGVTAALYNHQRVRRGFPCASRRKQRKKKAS